MTATNVTQHSSLGWTPEPDGRGTFGILRSCIATLALCVYSSIHINLAAAHDSKTTVYLRKAKWVVIAMFAPELVVYVAWCQLRATKQIQQQMLSCFKKLEERDPKAKRTHPWTSIHSWYVFMGGFAVDTSPSNPDHSEYIPGSPQICLAPEAVYVLASSGLIPDISSRYITDKSKADSLAKLLVIAQSMWMISQCIMRWSSSLFVTPLELNTLAHAVCALLIYLLWWDKPLDITEPTLLVGDQIRSITALLWSTRRRLGPKINFDGTISGPQTSFHEVFSGPELANIHWVELSSLPSADGSNNTLKGGEPVRQTADINKSSTFAVRLYNTSTKLYSERNFDLSNPASKSCLWVGMNEIVGLPKTGIYFSNLSTPRISVDRDCLCRWQISWDWIQSQGDLFTVSRGMSIFEHGSWEHNGLPAQKWFIHKPFPPRITNWHFIDPRTYDETGIASVGIFILCTLSYGGIHAAAWNDMFPSGTEHLLWKISCLYLPCFGIPVMAVIFTMYLTERAHMESYRKLMAGRPWPAPRRRYRSVVLGRIREFGMSFSPHSYHYSPFLFWPGVFCLGAFSLLYVGARSFLVVDAFLSLRSSPSTAYATPDWTRYFPHL
ncbi:hypothetical protein B0H63DRAFT_105505 [Podospora didyma]|uniref:Uncharacterized protein n=1 Tax=Podospora didyma TaxID=330526 RepID=A0AAE0NYT4_9PEZI|nr:hypothetical protein B0H63DRAFT_105505 [Podospora didyma]